MKTKITLNQTLVTILLVLFSNISLYSQQSDWIWKYAKSSTDGEITKMISDSVGNIYITGKFFRNQFSYQGKIVPGMTGNGESNVFLMKIAPTGRLNWLHSARSLNPGVSVSPLDIKVNQRGDLVALFVIDAATDFQLGGSNGQTTGDHKHTLITKISKTGYISYVHELTVGYDTVPEIYSPSFFIDEEGSTYLAGSFEGDDIQINGNGTDGTRSDAMLFVAKILADGTVDWINNCFVTGDNGDIYVTSMANSNADHFYIGGTITGARSFYFGSDSVTAVSGEDAFLAMYTKDGVANWSRRIYGGLSDYIDDLYTAKNGDVFVTGAFNSPSMMIEGKDHSSIGGNFDVFIARYRPDGTFFASTTITTQMLGFDPFTSDLHTGIDLDDNLLICSEFYGDSVFDDPYKLNNTMSPASDLLMAKLDGTSMVPLWTKQATGAGSNDIEDADFNTNGDMFFTGTSYSKLTIDTETVDENLTDGCPYVTKIAGDGTLNYLYWQYNNGGNFVTAKEVVCDRFGNTYVAGNFHGPSTMLDDIGLVQPSDSGMFIAKYSRVRDVSGHVFDDSGIAISQGYVKIYGYTFFQRSPLNDSVPLEADGAYVFEDIPFGKYILVAIPEGEIRADFVQTYYPSYEYWEFAKDVIVNATSITSGLDIEMKSATEFVGHTLFQGNVQEEEEDDLKSASFLKARPSQKATVVMAGQKSQKSTYEIVATAETDAAGNFEFHDIEDGSYYLWTDIPGLPVEDVYLIEVAGNSFVSSLDYLVTEEKVIATGLPIYSSIQNISENSNISVYPNPAQEILIIELNNSTIGICDLYDAQGKLLEHVKLNSKKEVINISEYPAGSYFVRILTDNEIEFRKINFIR